MEKFYKLLHWGWGWVGGVSKDEFVEPPPTSLKCWKTWHWTFPHFSSSIYLLKFTAIKIQKSEGLLQDAEKALALGCTVSGKGWGQVMRSSLSEPPLTTDSPPLGSIRAPACCRQKNYPFFPRCPRITHFFHGLQLQQIWDDEYQPKHHFPHFGSNRQNTLHEKNVIGPHKVARSCLSTD